MSLVSPRRTWCSLELISLQPQLSGGPRKSTDVMCDLPSSPRWGEGHCPPDPLDQASYLEKYIFGERNFITNKLKHFNLYQLEEYIN